MISYKPSRVDLSVILFFLLSPPLFPLLTPELSSHLLFSAPLRHLVLSPPPHVYLFPCDPSCQDADPRGPSSKTSLSFSPFTSSLFIFTRHPAVPPLLSSLLLLCVGTSLECSQPSKTPSNQKYARCCCYCLKS